MSLGTPWMLVLLPLVALTGGLVARARRLQRQAACRLNGAPPEDSPARFERRDVLAMAALACTVLALARPQWNPRPYSVERRGRNLVIALDVSRSMLAADNYPNRLEAARIVIHEALPALAGQRIALVTFAGSASVRVPLTLDHDFVRYMLDRADPSDEDLGSTSLQAAFEKSLGTVLADASGGHRDVVVFTDGEDHLSDIDATAEILAECGARVLIIGLGDTVRGAPVPAVAGGDPWMRYEDRAVVSRHHERLLAELAEKSRHVTYYPARTRPFDLVTLYRKMVAGSTDDVVVGELQAVRYTEGYPLLLGLAVALWIAASPARFPWTRAALCGILLVPGCRRQADEEAEAEFQAKFLRGAELLQYAQEQSEADVQAGRLLLEEAREQFLDAGLLKPGDRATAREITAATRRLRQLDAAIAEQRAREQERHADLAELVRRLQGLTDRQRQLSQQSRQVLLRRPVLTRDELDRLASPVAEAQRAVREATARVLDTVAFQRDTLRELLRRAYGDVGGLPPTEFDPPASQLAVAIKAQERALSSLAAGSVRWPRANTALHAAAGRMQDALDLLRGQLPPETDTADRRKPARNDRDGDQEPAEDGSSADDQQTPSESPGDFSTALSLRSLPVPNQTSAEILAEEVANQTQRAQQKAARAGSRVEKNW